MKKLSRFSPVSLSIGAVQQIWTQISSGAGEPSEQLDMLVTGRRAGRQRPNNKLQGMIYDEQNWIMQQQLRREILLNAAFCNNLLHKSLPDL